MNLVNVETKNFKYVNYDNQNLKHEEFINDIFNDELTKKFFSNWKQLFNTSDNDVIIGLIVEKEHIPVGLITLIQVDDYDYVFSHIIAPKYRGQRYSSILKNELLEYIFEKEYAKNIICYIDRNNKNSISSMLRTNPDSIEIDNNDNNMLKVIYQNKNFKTKECKENVK